MKNPLNKTIISSCVIAACLAISTGSFAQQPSKQKQAEEPNIHIAAYKQAVSIGDANMAITAVHYLLASDFVKYSNWQDTLALLYLQNNSFQQAYILSNALVANRGYSDMRMEIKAISAKNLQQPTEAINAYAALYSKTHNPVFGYEELSLEYGIHRLTESVATGNSLLKDLASDTTSAVNIARADNKSSQQVLLKSAVSNLLGLAYFDLKDKEKASSQFEMALKGSPDFELARKNLDFVTADIEKLNK